jgi:hypothetical protein
VLRGTLHDYILAIMALTAKGYFLLFAYRLYSTTLGALEARAEKGRPDRRARAIEVDLGRGAAARRDFQHRQIAFPPADEPRAAHTAQRHPRILGGDEG